MMIGGGRELGEFVLEIEPEVFESTLALARIGRLTMGRSSAESVLIVLTHFRISVDLIGLVNDR